MTRKVLLPGANLGVLGGGQLGRMFAQAARRMGYDVAVFTPETDSPAGQVASRTVCAPFEDLDAVADFARSVDVVTLEFENVPVDALEAVERHTPVHPGRHVLSTAQHRLREKRELSRIGVQVAPFARVATQGDLRGALDSVGSNGVLKTATLGYDGKGQRRVESDTGLSEAWTSLRKVESVYEGFIPFEHEISVVGARGTDGAIALFPPTLNAHVNHILDVSVAPLPLGRKVADDASEVARTVLEGLDVVGVLCVEMFVLGDGTILVNEIAPRPHNAGHLTIEACATSQFEQQVRAIAGLPLGDASLERPAAMANLIGDLWEAGEPEWNRSLAVPGVRLHLYGKATPRPKRKMGHLTATGVDHEEARERALRARSEAVQALRDGVLERR